MAENEQSTVATISTGALDTKVVNGSEGDKKEGKSKKKKTLKFRKDTKKKKSKKEKKGKQSAEGEATNSDKVEGDSGETGGEKREEAQENEEANGSATEKGKDEKTEEGADGEFDEDEEEPESKLDCYYLLLAAVVGLVIFGVLVYFIIGSMLRNMPPTGSKRPGYKIVTDAPGKAVKPSPPGKKDEKKPIEKVVTEGPDGPDVMTVADGGGTTHVISILKALTTGTWLEDQTGSGI